MRRKTFENNGKTLELVEKEGCLYINHVFQTRISDLKHEGDHIRAYKEDELIGVFHNTAIYDWADI